ncbi:Nicotinate-nucleotide--dimethylbenzimidazole phosphoribosyltransferase [Thalassocella blandensis]|nr:Nicotinate-nucleotide--dimethylbenzimidazole phosphoribosyltransferase [Thalassocella blandensis]
MTNLMAWLTQPAKMVSDEFQALATQHQQQLTKPAGALGALETLAIKFAGWQGKKMPTLERIGVRIFAADHGVCQQNISAFPQEVTAQMVLNFISGGAAISVLSRELNADFAVVNMGVKHEEILQSSVIEGSSNYLNRAVAPGTRDFTEAEAMSFSHMAEALNAGREVIENQDWDIFVGGEMGIGNTSAAAAIYSALLKLSAEYTVGPGAGLDRTQMLHKQAVIEQALNFHGHKLQDPLAVLQCLGGYEIAALTGSYIAAAQRGIPVLVDGFISTAAALLAININPGCKAWLVYSHCSAEPAHKCALESINEKPLVDLSLRLGEGSGAALVIPLIKSALSLHNNMATFASAGVSK